jgi:hypothetical protein
MSKKKAFFAYKEHGSLDTGPSQEKQEFFSLPKIDFLICKDIWQTLNSTPKDQTKVITSVGSEF